MSLGWLFGKFLVGLKYFEAYGWLSMIIATCMLFVVLDSRWFVTTIRERPYLLKPPYDPNILHILRYCTTLVSLLDFSVSAVVLELTSIITRELSVRYCFIQSGW